MQPPIRPLVDLLLNEGGAVPAVAPRAQVWDGPPPPWVDQLCQGEEWVGDPGAGAVLRRQLQLRNLLLLKQESRLDMQHTGTATRKVKLLIFQFIDDSTFSAIWISRRLLADTLMINDSVKSQCSLKQLINKIKEAKQMKTNMCVQRWKLALYSRIPLPQNLLAHGPTSGKKVKVHSICIHTTAIYSQGGA